jgi:hypothetical protein
MRVSEPSLKLPAKKTKIHHISTYMRPPAAKAPHIWCTITTTRGPSVADPQDVNVSCTRQGDVLVVDVAADGGGWLRGAYVAIATCLKLRNLMTGVMPHPPAIHIDLGEGATTAGIELCEKILYGLRVRSAPEHLTLHGRW